MINLNLLKPGGQAFLQTLAEGLGDNFTPEVKTSWLKLNDLVIAQMSIGVEQARNEQLQKLSSNEQ